MAGETHLLCTVHGGYSSGLLSGETWAMNLRLALVFGTVSDLDSFPALDVTEDISSGAGSDFHWESNFGIDGPPTFTLDVGSYIQDQLAPAWADFFHTEQFSGLGELRGGALYPISTSGRAVGGHSAHWTYDSPIVGIATTTLLPTEVATCMSWQTHRLGKRGKGRIYLPCVPRTVVNDDSSVGEAYSTSLLALGQALLDGVALSSVTAEDPHIRPVVTGAPYVQYGVINEIRIGSVFDAQRRRRRQLAEVYASAEVTYT